jgi:uncharacterized protein YndB with AHSA1/START domain
MDRVIHCSANLGCHPAEAFQHFVSNRLLEAWLTNVADVEPRVGGKYELFWDPADRENDSTIGCKVTAIEPGAFLAFEWKSPKQFKALANFSDPLTHVVVCFSPVPNGSRVDLIHSGWRSSGDWRQAADWQEQAWARALRQLEETITAGA